MFVSPTTAARLWARVDKNGPVPDTRPDLGRCWVWTGAKTDGYGVIFTGRVGARSDTTSHNQLTHRVSYMLLRGPIPDGLELDHLCRNPACANPDHLEPVTPVENVMRGVGFAPSNAGRTHCVNGHAFDESNTWFHKRGWRVCRHCRADRERARRAVQGPKINARLREQRRRR